MIIKNSYTDPDNEEVLYQNPLLFLKVWEINEEPDYYMNSLEESNWHFHKEVEFLAIIEGNLAIQHKYSSYILQPNDVFIMGASQPHRSCKPTKGKLRYIVLQVDLAKHFDQTILPYLYCFSELTTPLEELNYIFEQEEVKKEIHQLILSIYNETIAQQKGYEIAINYAIKRILLLLIRSDTKKKLNHAEISDLNRIKPVLDYVDSHIHTKISVETASTFLNFSYHYFIKYFKRTMGMSFIDYVHYKRMKKAELLLLTSEKSITEVSYEVGISNMAQFYKIFKRYNHCSPKEYRLRLQKNE